MGASFQTLSLPGNLTRDQVKAEFRKEQEQDRYENGHSYSGGLGMAQGLRFEPTAVFPSANAADDYLADACVKWEEARAVRHQTLDGKEMWLIGAICAS